MSLWTGFDASASGLTAERLRLDLIASNLANVNSVQGPGGQPYRREVPVFAALQNGQVEVVAIARVRTAALVQNQPGNPLAGPGGNVLRPNANVTAEMVNMLAATRAYEANATALDAVKQTFKQGLSI